MSWSLKVIVLFCFACGCNLLPTKPTNYSFDYDMFLSKNLRSSRVKRMPIKRFPEIMLIDNVDVNLNWEKFLSGRRLGCSFTIKKGDKLVERATLDYPKDFTFTARNLLDASGYSGELKILRNETNENSNSTDEKDIFHFKLDTARIVSSSETTEILEALSALPKLPVKLQTVSVTLRLPKQEESVLLEAYDLANNVTHKMIVRVDPRTVMVVVNDLPAQTVMKIVFNSIEKRKKMVMSINLFTGSVSQFDAKMLEQSASRFFFQNTPSRKRHTVTCYVKNKSPFQGFPCARSSVCIPLHWECDGDDDCQDGFDEQDCTPKITTYSIDNNNKHREKCRRNEFDCVSRGIHVCMPFKWLCDGRKDCADGWDEHKDNCNRMLYPGGNGQVNRYHHQNSNFCRNQFRCFKGGCLAWRHVCDDHRDCADGSDEYDCPDDEETYEPDEGYDTKCDNEFEFQCGARKSKCIPRPWVCDDQNDCHSGEDESPEVCRNHYHNFND